LIAHQRVPDSVGVKTAPTGTVNLSIVIVNYNGATFIEHCLASARRECGWSVEIIVLDNASTDDSVAILRRSSHDVILIESTENLGFARGVNAAAKFATAPVIMLLNPDAQVRDGVYRALHLLVSDSSIGVVGPRVCYPNGDLQLSCGFDHTPLRIVMSWTGCDRIAGLWRWIGRVDRSRLDYSSTHDTRWVSGACFLVKREIWDRVGGFDPRYFMYVEDVDFCRTVRVLGKRVVYSPVMTVVHREGGTVEGFNEAALHRSAKSYLAYCRKWHGESSALFVRFALALIFSLRWVVLSLIIAAQRASPERRRKAAAQRRLALALIFERWSKV
jgi:N-acetylglucosaminyl-diphospho-decaprenol L-rhamnosyltransferase